MTDTDKLRRICRELGVPLEAHEQTSDLDWFVYPAATTVLVCKAETEQRARLIVAALNSLTGLLDELESKRVEAQELVAALDFATETEPALEVARLRAEVERLRLETAAAAEVVFVLRARVAELETALRGADSYLWQIAKNPAISDLEAARAEAKKAAQAATRALKASND